MRAALVRDLPTGDILFEPKWDGFRALAFVDADRVQLQSRHGRSLSSYFPNPQKSRLMGERVCLSASYGGD